VLICSPMESPLTPAHPGRCMYHQTANAEETVVKKATTKEHPILFKGEMVRAILEGRKTQTRRLITGRNSLLDGGPMFMGLFANLDFDRAHADNGPSPAGNAGPYLHVPRKLPRALRTTHRIYPKVFVGDGFWVKETWSHDAESVEACKARFEDAMPSGMEATGPYYRATESYPGSLTWKPSIYMPRWASRIDLEVKAVWPERVQDISEEDARSEGGPEILGAMGIGGWLSYKDWFRDLWQAINKKSGHGWAKNDLVWVYEFKWKKIKIFA